MTGKTSRSTQSNAFKTSALKTNTFKKWALTGCALSVLATYGSAFAQEAKVFEFKMNSVDLGTALTEFSITTGNQVLFNDADIAGMSAASLNGNYTTDQAIKVLLAETGVQYSVDANGTLLVGDRFVSKGAKQAESIQKYAQVETPIATTRTVVKPKGSSGDGVPVEVTGVIFAEGSGARLKGARIEIEETGQVVSTDDLGRFRLTNVAPGEYTLSVDYLGFAPQSTVITVDGSAEVKQHFTLTGGTEEDAVYVYGSRSARAQALNLERMAPNVSTVLSSDLLGSFTGTTLSESLRRAPGVIFERSSDTGDGANIVVRGLAPDFNVIKMNGVELPDGTGVGRSANLSNILTESISKVTISKTLLPSQDSSGAGGLVEIETKSPFDRPKRYASFLLEGTKKGSGFGGGYMAAGTVSGTFGKNDQFGLAVSLQYRERETTRISYNTRDDTIFFGQYLPLQVDGTPSIRGINYVDPRTPFPFESGADEVYIGQLGFTSSEVEVENLAFTLSGAWEVGSHSRLFFDYQRLDRNDTRYTSGTGITAKLGYGTHDINSLGGEPRQALEWQSNQRLNITSSYNYLPDTEAITDVYSFRGESDLGNWHLNYLAGYTEGTTSREINVLNVSVPTFHLTSNELLPEAFHTIEGRVLSPFPRLLPGDGSFPEPLLSEAGFNLINDPENYGFGTIRHTVNKGRNERYIGELSARYNFNGSRFKYLEAGLSYKESEFRSGLHKNTTYYDIGGLTLADFGLVPRSSSLADIGVSTQLNQISRADLVPFLVDYVPSIAVDCNPSSTCPTGTLLRRSVSRASPLLLQQYTNEDEFAAYVQGAFEIGKLEVIGGVRMTKVGIEAVNLVAPSVYDEFFSFDQEFYDDNSVLKGETAEQTDFLPRLLANYRYKDNVVFRGGYYLSVARPQIELLSTTPNVFLALAPYFGPSGNQPTLTIVKGNPNLVPAKTHSFDFSAEYYDNAVGVLKIGAFYKRIDDLLESSVSNGEGFLSEVANILPDDPRFQDVLDNPTDYDIVLVVPENNDTKAEIWGFETSLEKQFTFLPGVWKGFGVYANYTYTNSSKEQPDRWFKHPVLDESGAVTGYETEDFIVSDVRFDGQAKHSGTFGLTYNQYGVDANLAYTAQARRQTGYDDFNLHDFEEGYGTLDFRIEYNFDKGAAQYRVYFEGADLTRGADDPYIQTSIGADDGVTPKYYTGGTYYGGRTFKVGVSAKF